MAGSDPIAEFQAFLDGMVLAATNAAYQRKCATQERDGGLGPIPPFITHREVIAALFDDDDLYDKMYALAHGGHVPLVLASLWRLTAAGAIYGFEEPESYADPVEPEPKTHSWYQDIRYWRPKDVLTQLAFVSIGLGGYPPPPEAYDE